MALGRVRKHSLSSVCQGFDIVIIREETWVYISWEPQTADYWSMTFNTPVQTSYNEQCSEVWVCKCAGVHVCA